MFHSFPCFTIREVAGRAPGNHITPAEHSHRRTSGTSCSTAFCGTSDEPTMMSEKSWQKAERGKTQASFRPHPSSIRLIHIVFIHYIYLLVPFVSIEHFSLFVCLFHTCQKIPIQAKMLQSSWFFHVFRFIFCFLVIIPPPTRCFEPFQSTFLTPAPGFSCITGTC